MDGRKEVGLGSDCCWSLPPFRVPNTRVSHRPAKEGRRPQRNPPAASGEQGRRVLGSRAWSESVGGVRGRIGCVVDTWILGVGPRSPGFGGWTIFMFT